MTLPLSADSLDANRRGELSPNQQRGFGARAASQRRSALSAAAMLIAGALFVAIFGSPNAFTSRMVASAIAGAIAVVLAVRAVTGIDALTRDLRAGRVASAEGAIGKRTLGGHLRNFFLDVGDARFNVSRSTYHAAPDAGLVRAYYLPRSRKVVNLERLPNAPLPPTLEPEDLLHKIGEGFLAPTRRARNEARAEIAAVGDAVSAAIAPANSPLAPPDDARALADAIVGTWSNPMMTATFSADGRVTLRTFGRTREGRWAVDGAGRLSTDVLGAMGTADARIAGGTLTVVVEGNAVTFSRQAAG